MAEVASGMTTTATSPSTRLKRDMGQKGNKVTELGIPIRKRKKAKRV